MTARESERALLLRVAWQAMLEHGLEPEFPPKALAEASALTDAATAHGDDVRDLRALLWCSIDNDDSRDLDQLTVADPPDGACTTIRVAVADVSATVARDTAIEGHARTNTTSVYTPPRIFPMLPERLSTDLTSLNPDVDRLAVVAEIAVGADGSAARRASTAPWCEPRQARLPSVGAWLQGEGPMPAKVAAVAGLADNLRLQDRVAQTLKAQRQDHGALELETIEVRAHFDGVTRGCNSPRNGTAPRT
jgi:exoribonuclease-2